MLIHYLTLAIRNARRAPVAFAINVFTLAVGLVCFITAYAFAAFWGNAERHFANADRIHVLTMSYTFLDRDVQGIVSAPLHAAETLLAHFPSLEKVIRVIRIAALTDDDNVVVSSGDHAVRLAAWAADPELFEIFELPFVVGDAAALDLPRSVALTQHAAVQLFGTSEDAIGKPLRIANTVDATVTAVIGPIPEPSHFGRSISARVRFDLLASVDVYEAITDARFAAPGSRQLTTRPSGSRIGSPLGGGRGGGRFLIASSRMRA